MYFITTWTHAGPQEKINARRLGNTLEQWVDAHLDAVLEGGETTDPDTQGQFTKTIVWTKGGITFTTVVPGDTQAECDEDTAEMVEGIEARGGTIVSVT